MPAPIGGVSACAARGMPPPREKRRCAKWLTRTLPIAVCTAAAGAMPDSSSSRRADRVLAAVAPAVRLGATPIATWTAASAAPHAVAVGGQRAAMHGDEWRLARLDTRADLWTDLRSALTGARADDASRPVDFVVFESDDLDAARSLANSVEQEFGQPPVEGCAALPGVAQDRVLSWQAADRGGVALTIPVERQPDARLIAQLAVWRGRWRPDRIGYGYSASPCGSSEEISGGRSGSGRPHADRMSRTV